MELEETRTKTGKRVWWKEPEFWSQADLSLPPGSPTHQEVTSNLSLYSPPGTWIGSGQSQGIEITDAEPLGRWTELHPGLWEAPKQVDWAVTGHPCIPLSGPWEK